MVTEQGRPAAEAAAAEASFTMLLADTQEQVRLEQQAIERAMPIVEGLVLGTSRMSDSAIRMAAKQQPMVVLNRSVAGVPSVAIDNAHGMRCAAEHLNSLGHRAITYVADPEGPGRTGCGGGRCAKPGGHSI